MSAASVVAGTTKVNWTVNVVFTVEDQFGKSLDSAWQGLGLAEHIVGSVQAFSGFVPGTPSTAIDASAHATDPVQYTSGSFPDAPTASAVVSGTAGFNGPSAKATLEYKAIDTDGTTYVLDGTNVRSVSVTNNKIKDSDVAK